ncbi:MAG: ABC transporter permease [Verrucomicrobiia bacterium]
MKRFFWAPLWTLWEREVVRFLRQRGRVVGALGTPVIFWLFIGSGVGEAFQVSGPGEGTSYLQFFFPGTVLMIVLFTAIFSTISIIEDRREGFLQGVLVAPVHPWAVALGKILGGATLAFGQGLVFFALAPVVGLRLGWGELVAGAGVLALASVALTALGFVFAWKSDSVQGYHGIMNLVLFPLWLLSGALFPRETAASWMAWVMSVNPLTYGLEGLRAALVGGPIGAVWLGVGVLSGAGLILTGLAAKMTAGSFGR